MWYTKNMKRLWSLLCLLLLLTGCGGKAADGKITYVPSETAGRPGQVTAAATAAPLFTAVPPSPTAAPTPVPTVELGEAERYFAVSFPDRQQERAIRRELDIPSDAIFRWQIAEIPELYFCGNMTVDAKAAVSFGADGTCRVNGAAVIQGQVSDLRLIGSMVKLERLALICQPLDDLSGLRGHLLLRELSLAGSRVDDLTALTELPSLETLRLEHTDVRDLTPLEGLPALKRVTVSRDMLPLLWSDGAPFAVELARDE